MGEGRKRVSIFDVKRSEFDQFADEYREIHARNIRLSGEDPEFFAEYKVRVAREEARRAGLVVGAALDFGAGVGNSIPWFRRHFPEASLTCADVSPRSLEVAAERFPKQARLLPIDGERIALADASVDLAFSACVFHHIDHAEHRHWLGELRRIVRPGGMLAVFEHNPWNPLTVRAVRDCAFDENAHLLPMPQLARETAAAGWGQVSHRFCVFFPGPLAALRPLEPAMGWLPLGAQYAVFARRP